MIKSHKKDHSIAFLCLIFEVSRTSYYNFEKGWTYNVKKKYSRPRHEIRLEFLRNMRRYGARRIQASLAQKQIKLSRRTVSKIMKEEGLKAIQRQRPTVEDFTKSKETIKNVA